MRNYTGAQKGEARRCRQRSWEWAPGGLPSFQGGSEPLRLAEGLRFGLSLDCPEGIGKDIPGGSSAGAKERRWALLRVKDLGRGGAGVGVGDICRKGCILQELVSSSTSWSCQILFNTRGCGEGSRAKSWNQKPVRDLGAMQEILFLKLPVCRCLKTHAET